MGFVVKYKCEDCGTKEGVLDTWWPCAPEVREEYTQAYLCSPS
mgnify:FL=1